MSGNVLSLEAAKRFAQLTTLKRRKAEELKAIEEEMTALERVIREDFAEHGMRQVNLPDFTIYLAKEVRARPINGDDEYACEALIAAGEEWLVKRTINRQSLSSWVRERLEDGDGDIPKPIADVLEITNVYRVRARAKN